MVSDISKGAERSVGVCLLLLLSACHLLSAQGDTQFTNWADSWPSVEPPMKFSSPFNSFDSTYNTVLHAMRGMFPGEESMSGETNHLFPQVTGMSSKYHSQNEALLEPAKRDSRVQARSQSSSRMRTLLRIQAPCAGTSGHFRSAQILPAPAAILSSPRDLLLSLGNEAGAARQVALQVMRRIESSAGMSRGVALVVGRSAVLQAGIGPQGGTAVGGEHQAVAALAAIYQQLARAAFILDQIAEGANPSLSPLVTSLTENRLYDLLCGLKVAMDAKDPGFVRNAAAMLRSCHLVEAPNNAFQLARDYSIIREVARLLADTGAKLVILSQFF